jgi:hemerythrin-like domain-containing protein
MSFDSVYGLTAFFHRHLDEVMLLHQEALLLQKFSLAEQLLMLFEDLLLAHIEAEDRILLPLFEKELLEKEQFESRWPALLYYKEHEKILAMMAKVKQKFALIAALEGSEQRRAMLALLEYQRTFKNVLEHHTDREEQALLPELDMHLGADKLAETIGAVEQQWQRLYDQQARQLESLRQQL